MLIDHEARQIIILFFKKIVFREHSWDFVERKEQEYPLLSDSSQSMHKSPVAKTLNAIDAVFPHDNMIPFSEMNY